MADKELFGISEQLDCSDCVNHGGDWDCDHVYCRKGTDTISRQAAIQTAERMCKRCDTSSIEDYHDLMVEALTALPSAQPGEDIRAMCGECDAWNQYKNYPQPGWIPWDSGKAPEESGCYIVTAYDGSGSRVTFAKYQKRLKRWELTGSRAYWRVLAWQHLPIPYREGGKDTDGEA